MSSSNRQEPLEILKRNGLTANFQPIRDVSNGSIYASEALIRGPERSQLHSPSRLFHTASLFGLHSQLEYACRHESLKSFSEQEGGGLLFINVSPMSLRKGHANSFRSNVLDRYGLSSHQIVIELSEQYPMGDFDKLREATHFYRDQGFGVAIDDFGAGYSSLRLWEEIRPDYVKIDRHFVNEINISPIKRQIIISLLMIANESGCKIIGEGVETQEQLETLNELGVYLAQGFFLGRPHEKLQLTRSHPIVNAREFNGFLRCG